MTQVNLDAPAAKDRNSVFEETPAALKMGAMSTGGAGTVVDSQKQAFLSPWKSFYRWQSVTG
jgi:hypothetical protein